MKEAANGRALWPLNVAGPRIENPIFKMKPEISMPASKKKAEVDAVVHIISELVSERGEADEEILKGFPEASDRTRISLETSNLKSYAVEFAVRQVLTDPTKTELLDVYNAKWDEWGEMKPEQGQCRNRMIAARQTYELGVRERSETAEVAYVVGGIFGALCQFEQLKGRIYRQGQTSGTVEVIIPTTYAEVRGERWSWCDTKLDRLRFKKSIADAAVDGVVPEGHLRTPAQAYQDLMSWLERLQSGEVEQVRRRDLPVPEASTNESDRARNQRRYGDFSRLNARWNKTSSEHTHQRLQQDREEWSHYHELYREARSGWTVVPHEEIIRWCQQRSDYVIGDFGCGEAQLAKAVHDRHSIHSFDHVGINEEVIECDTCRWMMETWMLLCIAYP